MSSGKWRPLYLALNVLNVVIYVLQYSSSVHISNHVFNSYLHHNTVQYKVRIRMMIYDKFSGESPALSLRLWPLLLTWFNFNPGMEK